MQRDFDSAIIIGFKKVWENDAIVSYHVIKLSNSGGFKDFIEFPVDKRPEMFDTIKVVNKNGYNTPTPVPSTIRTKESVSAKMYNFIVENYSKTEDIFEPNVPMTVGGYMEGVALEVSQYGKIIMGKPNGERIIAHAHDLIKHVNLSKGDKVRIVGDFKEDSHEMYVYVLGCQKYIPEEKPSSDINHQKVKKDIDECEATQESSQSSSTTGNSNTLPRIGGGNKITITKSGYELSAEGLSFFADRLRDDMKIKVLRGSSRRTRMIYVWKDGYYHDGGDIDIEVAVKEELQELHELKWFNIVFNHIVSKSVLETENFKTPKRTTNIENGILEYKDFKKGVVFIPRKHALDFHEMNFVYKIPVVYDPTKKCPEIETIVQQILVDKNIDKNQIDDLSWIQKLTTEELADRDNQERIQEHIQKYRDMHLGKDPAVEKLTLFYEFVGFTLLSEYEWKKAITLLGYPHSGKSTLLNIVRKLLGERNCASVPLQKLDSDRNRFAASRLAGKFLNVCEELPHMNLKTMDVFKAATGGSTIDAEKKGFQGFEFNNNAKFWLAGNETVTIDPKVFASTMSRLIAIELTNKFEEAEESTMSAYKDRYYSQDELSGLLNIAIFHLNRLMLSGGKFTGYDQTNTSILWSRYNNIDEQNPVKIFIEECCVVTGIRKDCIPRKELYEAFDKYGNDTKMEQKDFTKAIGAYKKEILLENGKGSGRYYLIDQKKIDTTTYWTGIDLNPSMKLSNPMERIKKEEIGEDN